MPSGETVTVRVSASAGGDERAYGVWFQAGSGVVGNEIYGSGGLDSREMPEWSVESEQCIRVRLLLARDEMAYRLQRYKDVLNQIPPRR